MSTPHFDPQHFLTKLLLKSALWTALLMGWSLSAFAQQGFVDNEILASRIANSIQQRIPPQYKALAISRIRPHDKQTSLNINELIDYTNVKIVRSRRFRVTDRSKLKLILKEQRIQLSEFVTPSEYKELGQILGVQVFVYGNVYPDSLMLKAIDVQTSSIVWADSFPLYNQRPNYILLNSLSGNFLASLSKDAERLRAEKIRKVSFWSIGTPPGMDSEEVIDALTVVVSQNDLLQVVDRENLKLIFHEQKLNQSVFIDESQARRLGELYGVDAFVYGQITPRPDGSYVASLKMMSIFSGVIVWADLIRFSPPLDNTANLLNPFTKKIQQRLAPERSQGQVAIPGGVFLMGSGDPLYGNAAPERTLRLKPFLIDAQEVSNAEYLQFVKQKQHRRPVTWKGGMFEESQKDYPVVGIGWEDAKLYCQALGKRLPTEQEWERTARGPKGRRYPWEGDVFSANFAVTRESGAKQSVPVFTRNRDVTPEGVRHLAGNVREYVADKYLPYSNPVAASFERVIRGSSWAFSAMEAVGFQRGHSRPNLAWPEVGFRCAQNL
jgi:formylglycine-generating enzyme required for sulfatase activity